MTGAREFWTAVVLHEQVEPLVFAGVASVDDFIEWLEKPDVHEERYGSGGLVFVDKAEGVQEVHVAFHPDAWGKRVALAFRDCFARKMRRLDAVIAHEQEGEWRTQPPKSHGWKVVGDWEVSPILPRRVRKWILTREAWYSSPVGRKTNELRC